MAEQNIILQNILFSSGRWNLDFNAAGQDLGWVEIDGNYKLSEIANEIVNTGAGTNASHAIPSPIAHVKDFKTRLDNNDEDALNEWRGMLAVIALREARGYEVSISDKSLSKTDLGKVFFDALKDNFNVTGYTDGENVTGYTDNNGNTHDPVLTVFSMRDRNGQDKPFAMFMPSIGICPFKEYPSEIFANVPWYDNGGHKWVDLKGTIQDRNNAGTLTVEEKGLVNWIASFKNNKVAYGYLSGKFKDYINPNKVDCGTDNTATDNGIVTSAWGAWKKYCPILECIPEKRLRFSDKLLLVVPPMKDDIKVIAAKKTKGFVPKKISIGDNDTDVFYAIPPISEEVINKLRDYRDTLSLEDDDWCIKSNEDHTEFKVSFCLSVSGGGKFRCEETFGVEKTAFVIGMPYISMWPQSDFYDNRWNDYLVSILMSRGNNEDFITSKENLQVSSELKDMISRYGTLKISASGKEKDSFNINVIPSGRNVPKRYKCKSNFVPEDENEDESGSNLNELDFSMIKSTSRPFALSFKYGQDINLGSWVISDMPKDENGARDGSVVVAMDFGTTSTNVYISDRLVNGRKVDSQSIHSPGEYVEDIYQPCGSDKRNLYQNYYLFSGKTQEKYLNKMFTFGQNFTAYEVSNNGQETQVADDERIHNICGRFINIDLDCLLQGGDNADDGIYSNLKWPNADERTEIDKARDNFISTILTSAILEAVKKGAGTVELHVSYPSSDLGAEICGTINSIKGNLENDSGITINCKYATEARSAGEFFKGNRNANVSSTSGYAVMDIGGGTTDISFWKDEPNPDDGGGSQLSLADGSEYSFKYAGRDIVENTVIRYFDNHRDGNGQQFTAIWRRKSEETVKRAIEKYVACDSERQNYEEKKGEILNCLMEFNQKDTDDPTRIVTPVNNVPTDLRKAMELKYCSLFYLVASYFKCKNINYDKGRFALCLAGCGSKGMKNFTDYALFEMKLNAILEKKLELTRPSKVYLPSRDDKSEVVRGLAMLPDNALIDTIEQRDGGTNARVKAQDYEQNVKEAYKELIHALLECYSNGTNILLKKVENDFNNEGEYIDGLPDAITKAGSTRCDETVFADLCAVYLLDYVINRLL